MCAIFKLGLSLFSLITLSAGDTRFECISSLGGSGGFGYGGGFGGEMGEGFGGMGDDMGEFEGMDDIGDGDGMMGGMGEGMGGMMAVTTAMGSLSCPTGRRGSILVKRITYGVNTFPGTCQPSPFCGVTHDAGEAVAKLCDGKSTCSVNTLQPKMLACGRLSTYIYVEYECVDTWATFEICETVSTVARSASIILTSPGYLGTSKNLSSDTRMCECIIQSHDKADMYMDYLQTDLASESTSCPYEFVLLESKKNLSQASNDKELEVCGKKQVSGKWFEGSLRLTYASGGSLQKRGLLAKFTVDNLGNPPMIELRCGKVPTNNLKLQERPPEKTGSNPPLNFGMPPFPTLAAAMPNFGLAAMGNMFNNMARPSSPPSSSSSGGGAGPSRGPPDFSNWKIKVAGETTTKEKTVKVKLPAKTWSRKVNNAAPANPNPGKAERLVPTRNNPNPQINNRRPKNSGNPRRKAKPGRVVDPSAVEEEKVKEKPNTSGNVALVFGAIGAVLIVGSVGILILHNYKKRQRIKREEAEYAAGSSIATRTYGKGWSAKLDEVDNNAQTGDEESVYATVADVEMYRMGGINPSAGPTADDVANAKLTSDASVECKLSRTSSEKTRKHSDTDDDDYNKIYRKAHRRNSYDLDNRIPARRGRQRSYNTSTADVGQKSDAGVDSISKNARMKPLDVIESRTTKTARRKPYDVDDRLPVRDLSRRRKSCDTEERAPNREKRRKSHDVLGRRTSYTIEDHIPIRELLRVSHDDSSDENQRRKNKQVAVIEVHHNYIYQSDTETESDTTSEADSTVTSPSVPHGTGCLDACMYATTKSAEENRCVECNIRRPPRKRDSERNGYDNNVGVNNKRKK